MIYLGQFKVKIIVIKLQESCYWI